MSAQPELILSFRPMLLGDLKQVVAIEQDVYPYPWTLGNFKDSLDAPHDCWLCVSCGTISGYGVMMTAHDEAHLLNLTVSRHWQRRGVGTSLLLHLLRMARQNHSQTFFLEVRPSNVGARRLYDQFGFRLIGMRRNYYPAPEGREDALVLRLQL
jgi:[ribosomal protein S18]-alanine N-acetyltransferase